MRMNTWLNVWVLAGLMSLLTACAATEPNRERDTVKADPKVSPAKTSPAGGVVHDLPKDLRLALVADPEALSHWDDLTPLARNEWICWVESVKKQETRTLHIARMCDELKSGKRRPCCWPGCPHRIKRGSGR